MKQGNYIRTEEMRKKASEASKKYLETHSHPRGMLGKHHSEKVKQKMREISKSQTEEKSERMKQYHKTHPHPKGMLGKKHSVETLEKMSQTRKGKKRPPFSEEWKKNIGLAAKGRKHSKETKKKISISSKGRKWSQSQIDKFIAARTGSKHPNWKGGKYKSHGYVYITKKKHPFADKAGKVFEHRTVMEKLLGRYLSPEEVIHHINDIKDDNRIENLKLFPNNKIHMQYHYDNRIIVLLPPE